MKKYRIGVVAGKFYPPHRGHKYLIDTAQSRSARVIVLVTDTPGLTIPAKVRAGWVQEIHPDADVRVIPDIRRDDDSEAWGAHTIGFLGLVPDAVFTSEEYGEGWSRAMGCAHECVDRARSTYPISGTRVRTDALAAWEFLEPPVREHYAKRVCVLGAESTGTTTLTQALAAHYRTVWVPEYGRVYAGGKYADQESEWRTDEFVHIAEQQARMEDRLARSANRVLICDTDPFATTIWHERYMGRPAPQVVAIAERRRYDMYILTGDEIPFVQDGVRDGEHIRHDMHTRFAKALESTGRPHVIVRGTVEERMRTAVRIIDPILSYATEEERRCTAYQDCH